MGFINYSLKYYYEELHKLETGEVTEESIYRAKQLLKMLDDLVDEGYTELSDRIEEYYEGVTKLKRYLRDNKTENFTLQPKPIDEFEASYEQNDIELTKAIDDIIERARVAKDISGNEFLQELIRFCQWIGYEENTAYIFLLRDTLLPYVYYKDKGRSGIYPWLLSRKAFEMLSGKEGVDDEVRAFIYEALEAGQCKDFREFCGVVLPNVRKTLSRYPEIENCLQELLKEIKEERVIVVESGCAGTFPLLLMSLDNRVDMRMYTTYPYLLDVYGHKIFTPKYEENRLFETMYSQDLYFKLSYVDNGHFYVNRCKSIDVEEKALVEVKAMLDIKE